MPGPPLGEARGAGSMHDKVSELFPRAGRTARESDSERLTLDREAVRYWRLQRGHTQESLARQKAELDGATVQISYAQIRRIEKEGRCGPASARILAALLDVQLAALFPRDAAHLPCGLPREVSIDFVGRHAPLEAV